jgi:hypothetical protein
LNEIRDNDLKTNNMKYLKIIVFLTFATFLSACSFGYDIVIINDSDKQIEIRYKVIDNSQFNEPMTKSIEDWNAQKSLKRFWTEEKPWQNLQKNEYETDLETRERTIKIQPKQIVKIEGGHYNFISEEYGDLTDIVELKIISPNGEITYKGKLLLNQFEKDGYTFIKTYKDEIKNRDLK